MPERDVRQMKSLSEKKKPRRLTVKHYARIIRSHKSELTSKYKVKEIGIFGSYVRGEQKANSDLDILVDFYEIPDLYAFVGLADYLEDKLKKNVDLVRKAAIRNELRDQILGEVVYL
jgi:predicted nucleotidyltransferase